MRYLAIAGLLALMASPALGQGYNPTAVGQGIVTDCSVTFSATNSPLMVLAKSGTAGGAQGNRTKVTLENISSHTMGFSFTMTSNLALTSTQQYVLAPVSSAGTNWYITGSEFVPMNQIYAVGQSGDTLVCTATGP